uniref:Amyloid beta precursor protein binding family A member 1 n=1 Tax=Astatotilapia calliptera TaxID=8154 RepID=A0AAX7T1Q0_ASTCA
PTEQSSYMNSAPTEVDDVVTFWKHGYCCSDEKTNTPNQSLFSTTTFSSNDFKYFFCMTLRHGYIIVDLYLRRSCSYLKENHLCIAFMRFCVCVYHVVTLCHTPVPGPCDPDDLIDGIIFAANYLGSTQLLSDKTPSKNIRMMQAQEAVSRIKEPEGEPQPLTEVDLFISTQRIKVLNADSQETMMDHPLRTISYIADIGNIVVLMARRRMPRTDSEENVETSEPSQDSKRQYKMICHVFESEDAQLIAQSIGQAFSVAYQEFLRANGINPEDLSQKEYSDLLNTQDMYNDDLVHFSKSENCKNVFVEKAKGEILGVVIVESGWGSILPTVIIANMMHAGPAERSGRLNIGDQIMSINGTSLVGLPLSTCQSIIKGLKNQSHIKLNIVRCPPVTTVLIRRPDLRYQLGFSVQNGIICSLMRGGIAERGGVRVGHRIIEINSQSVVATPHEKIVHILSSAVGEIHMKTMPAAMYRLLTAQEQPVYI